MLDAFVGLPLLALTVPVLLLAADGGIAGSRPARIRPALPRLLAAFTGVLIVGLVLAATFGSNDLDEPEEVVFAGLAVVWTLAAAVATAPALSRLR